MLTNNSCISFWKQIQFPIFFIKYKIISGSVIRFFTFKEYHEDTEEFLVTVETIFNGIKTISFESITYEKMKEIIRNAN